MLIRISGGSAGIGKYLRDGRKQGRGYSRDELDERIVLYGDLELTESIIAAIPREGERYLHVTLAFKEDVIATEIIREIVEEFRKFALAAYRCDEFNFYAEAHLPKIKSYINKGNGDFVERKPHIHIVIPEHNLLTGKRLDPFGLVERQVKFLEAFQESINNKYGLASPKDNRRLKFTGESEIISRYKGDAFKGAGAHIKQCLVDDVMSGMVGDFEVFKKHVESFGVVNIRNSGLKSEYLNVLPIGAKKGINLKEYMFSREFIDLPIEEKRLAMLKETKSVYTESGVSRPTSGDLEKRLKEWYEVRAFELKYINSGGRSLYKNFRAADRDVRVAMLAELAGRFYERHDVSPHGDLSNTEFDYKSIVDIVESQVDMQAQADSAVAHISRMHAEEKIVSEESSSPVFSKIKRELDAQRLLVSLSKTHGVIIEKYKVTKGRDGGERIKCGTRNLNVSDFLTAECNIPWSEAAEILAEEYHSQVADHVIEARKEIDKQLWAKFRDSWPQSTAQKGLDWENQHASERTRRETYKREYQKAKAAIRANASITHAARRVALSLAAMNKVAADIALRESIAQEQAALKARYARPLSDQYIDFLLARADYDASALDELRRVAGIPGMLHRQRIEGNEQASSSSARAPLSYRIERSGAVVYFSDLEQTRTILIDTGRSVQVPDSQQDFVESGLRLALHKFGPQLSIAGSNEFKALLIKVAVERRLRIEFSDEMMSRIYQTRLAEQERDYQRGRAWAEQQKREEVEARKWIEDEAKDLVSAQPAVLTHPDAERAEQEAVTPSPPTFLTQDQSSRKLKNSFR